MAHYQETYKALVEAGGAKEAPTAQALATLHGIDGDALADTIAQYNRAARSEVADPFGRTQFGMAPLQVPYVITRVNSALFHTQGGLMVDAQAHVMRADGSVIPNLFAGGGAAVGLSGKAGGNGYVSGNGLLTATVLGFIAGETAAAELGVAETARNRSA